MSIKMIINPTPDQVVSGLPEVICERFPYGVAVVFGEHITTLIEMIGWINAKYGTDGSNTHTYFRTYNHFRFKTEAELFEFVLRWRGVEGGGR